MGTAEIRTAVVGDHDEVRALSLRRPSSMSNEGDREFILANPDTLAYDPSPLGEGRTRIAIDGGRIVGFSTTSVDVDAEVEALFVEPSVMRTGVGRALVSDVVERARAAGVSRVNVTANLHALAFYDAVGFVTDGLIATRGGQAARMHLDIR